MLDITHKGNLWKTSWASSGIVYRIISLNTDSNTVKADSLCFLWGHVRWIDEFDGGILWDDYPTLGNQASCRIVVLSVYALNVVLGFINF